MTDREKVSANNRIWKHISAGLAVLLCLLMLSGCSQSNGAEKKVTKELTALQTSDVMGSEVISLRDSLSEDGKANFDGFLEKLRGFDFEITGSEEAGGDDGSTVVTAKIKTFDFGREYLAVWTEYLKSNEGTQPEDMTAFYELLFSRLNSLEEKDYFRSIRIVCIDPLGNGEWIANIKENEELQDAVFGGMLSEMKALAAE